eukprot:353375-Chlamydomonas_euryale.AAC.15
MALVNLPIGDRRRVEVLGDDTEHRRRLRSHDLEARSVNTAKQALKLRKDVVGQCRACGIHQEARPHGRERLMMKL